MVKLLIDTEVIKPHSLAAVARKHRLGLLSTELLSPTEAAFWCTACTHLLSAPTRAAHSQGDDALSASAADVMFECADAMMPESAQQWCTAVRRHVGASPPQWHPAGHLLSVMLQALNYSDAATATAALDFCCELVSLTLNSRCALAMFCI